MRRTAKRILIASVILILAVLGTSSVLTDSCFTYANKILGYATSAKLRVDKLTERHETRGMGLSEYDVNEKDSDAMRTINMLIKEDSPNQIKTKLSFATRVGDVDEQKRLEKRLINEFPIYMFRYPNQDKEVRAQAISKIANNSEHDPELYMALLDEM